MRIADGKGRVQQLLTGRPMTLFAVVAPADVMLAATDRRRARWLTKPLLMPTLMLGRPRSAQRALALGGLGDVALLGKSDKAFTAGLCAFLAGHIAWIAALQARAQGSATAGMLRRRPALAAPYLVAWSGLNAYLWPRTGRDRYPVVAYSTVLLAMALVALDSGRADTAAGGALFMASDGLLALEKFGGVAFPGSEGVVMATYTAAQALLAANAG